MRIQAIETILVDIPTRRAHLLSFGAVARQSYVVVRMRDADGREGLGEAATIGGPSWSEESPESIKATIDAYLAPVLIGADVRRFELQRARMDKAVRGNRFAKAGLEMAAIDLVARSLNVPAADLIGGRQIDSIPLIWTLATGEIEKDVAEAEEKIALGLHRIFKIKIGYDEPRTDVARVAGIARALDGRAGVRVDVNQAWDEPTAHRYAPALQDAGVELIEQPLQAWNIDGAARLAAAVRVPIMADESVCTPQDAVTVVKAAAADVFSLKVMKSGGLFGVRRVAAIAEGAGIPCYGGCMLESGIGTAASAQVFATMALEEWGCELFGPLLLADDITTAPLRVTEHRLWIPEQPGFGVTLDDDKLDFYRRDRTRTDVPVAALP